MVKKFEVKHWKGKDIKEECWVTTKIDGAQVQYINGVPFSRTGKDLPALPVVGKHMNEIFELFYKDWGNSISMLRGTADVPFDHQMLYSIGTLDPRLVISYRPEGFTAVEINQLFGIARERGHEGLVIVTASGKRWKVKDKETHDVIITDLKPGKNEGMMGSFITERGNVPVRGNELKKDVWDNPEKYIGKTMEVECMELTESGKFRQPTMLRFRPDKD